MKDMYVQTEILDIKNMLFHNVRLSPHLLFMSLGCETVIKNDSATLTPRLCEREHVKERWKEG